RSLGLLPVEVLFGDRSGLAPADNLYQRLTIVNSLGPPWGRDSSKNGLRETGPIQSPSQTSRYLAQGM
ncbi:hypothetical protein, partial [Paraburkholderia aspalathi]|uniref:hypothetical protein n=1 Tax=Paraburkholderia aspalathi TaxID=1324617 RepID=UPI0038BA0782